MTSYCATRSSCDDLAAKLQKDGIQAKSYHAGLSNSTRRSILQSWTGTSALTNSESKSNDIVDIVVATISFGMGIDRKDVRFVVHWDMPKSLEGTWWHPSYLRSAYYQESGRAGRDGKVSRCILYYSRQDRDRITYLIKQDADSSKKEMTISSFNEVGRILLLIILDGQVLRECIQMSPFSHLELL
jgi:superfamily II DNA helicase RecQ